MALFYDSRLQNILIRKVDKDKNKSEKIEYNIKTINEDNITKYKAFLHIFDKIFESKIFLELNDAKESCAEQAILYNKEKKLNKEKFEKNMKLIGVLYFLLITLILPHFLSLLKLFMAFLIGVLVSPYFIKHMDVATSVGMGVKVRRTKTIENCFRRISLTITNGDLVLVGKKAKHNISNNFNFEAILTKNLVLFPIEDKTLPAFILRKNNSVRINRNQDGTFYITFLTKQIDGKNKNYVNYNLSKEYFSTNFDFEKHHVFSKHGFHVVLTRYLDNSNLDSVHWYILVLTIYFNFIVSSFLYIYQYLTNIFTKPPEVPDIISSSI